jgi:hypothetical protein
VLEIFTLGCSGTHNNTLQVLQRPIGPRTSYNRVCCLRIPFSFFAIFLHFSLNFEPRNIQIQMLFWNQSPYRMLCRSGSGGGGDAPLKLEKIWLFDVKSWFFTRNTPTIFAPPFALRNFFKCNPLTWNPGFAPVVHNTNNSNLEVLCTNRLNKRPCCMQCWIYLLVGPRPNSSVGPQIYRNVGMFQYPIYIHCSGL